MYSDDQNKLNQIQNKMLFKSGPIFISIFISNIVILNKSSQEICPNTIIKISLFGWLILTTILVYLTASCIFCIINKNYKYGEMKFDNWVWYCVINTIIIITFVTFGIFLILSNDFECLNSSLGIMSIINIIILCIENLLHPICITNTDINGREIRTITNVHLCCGKKYDILLPPENL